MKERSGVPQESWPFIIVVILLGIALILKTPNFQELSNYALVAITGIYAYATIKILRENKRTVEEMKQSRLDAVKPALSLQPGVFLEGGGFILLYLVNSGGLAKDLNIDIQILDNPEIKRVFLTSLTNGSRVIIPTQNSHPISEEEILLKVSIQYKDGYNQVIHDDLSLDLKNLKTEGREIIGQETEQYEVSQALKGIERRLNNIEHVISQKPEYHEITRVLSDIERRLRDIKR